MYRNPTALMTAALLGCLAAGCGKKTATDGSLITDIQAKLYGDAVTKAANVSVAAKDGIVTLSGDVPSSDVELEAMKIANGTPGVTRVDDQMKVNPALPADMSANQTAPGSPGSPAPPQQYPNGSAPGVPPGNSPAPTPQEPPSGPPPQTAAVPIAPPRPASVTVPAGEGVSVRMIDSINSAHNTAGQVFRASLSEPLVVHGRTVVRTGAPVSVLLTTAKGAGRIKGNSQLEVRLSQLEYRGRSYEVNSSVYEEQGKGRGKGTAVRTGIGAAAGAVIGAIAGGGKGAAIGSAAGGGAGFGTAVFTHGQQVKIPSETIVNFRLEAPLRIVE